MSKRTTTLKKGDCVKVMRGLDDNSVDSIVTDPPYELGFMSKSWDKSGIANSVEMWAEALRVLKPGGYLLAFSGSRTYHRMVCAIEDAGFEIRDQIMWVYGSGFPKSHDVAKHIDRQAGATREKKTVSARRYGSNNWKVKNGGQASHWMADAYAEGGAIEINGDKPVTDAARRWQGWGTALKPAHEPIVVARKPLQGTVAQNVAKWGTGALNIDASRIEAVGYSGGGKNNSVAFGRDLEPQERCDGSKGRWPANLIHDGLPQEWARFFYCAKASKADRGEGNNHPTVKPRALMEYLCRLVTPPGGLILDPFMGSGSTGIGAALGGFSFIGCDLSAEYVEISRRRIAAARKKPAQHALPLLKAAA